MPFHQGHLMEPWQAGTTDLTYKQRPLAPWTTQQVPDGIRRDQLGRTSSYGWEVYRHPNHPDRLWGYYTGHQDGVTWIWAGGDHDPTQYPGHNSLNGMRWADPARFGRALAAYPPWMRVADPTAHTECDAPELQRPLGDPVPAPSSGHN